MYIAELSEPLRELVCGGIFSSTTLRIYYMRMTQKIQHIFSQYIKEAELKDFMNGILSAGITRGFMAKMRPLFYHGKQIKKITEISFFTLYKVPEAKQEEVIGQILKMDLKPIAEKTHRRHSVRKAEEGFEPVWQKSKYFERPYKYKRTDKNLSKVAAICTEDGLTEGRYCETCGAFCDTESSEGNRP